ncbi:MULTISPECIES: LURP-one-related/scramblase family protein [Enterococcus]|uniref:LURP-one-related/scramblase family protein n=1 Tax=Enterococcus TaxID=1350 RepID=UPI0003AA3E39|nr:LURP-one-related family protein [Enterococcus haemoperoxidus]
MSEFFIQEQQLSKVTRTLVKDEDGKSIFLLVGRWGTRGDALSLYTMSGELVASIRQTSFAFGSRFDLYKGFEKVGVLRKILNLNADFYYIQHMHWTVLGDIRNHRYSIYQVNRKVMEMSKATLFSGNYFSLEVADDEDAPLCICVAAVLDYWLYNKKKNQNHKPIIGWGTC